MLRPAAVSAAAASTVWLLAVLGPVLSLPAEDNSGADFSLCSRCFYRQTPPQGASAGLLLRPLCHRLPGGQTFATLSKTTCDTAVYSAFHLSHEGAEEGEEGGDPMEEGTVPALLRGEGDPSDPVSNSPLQHWDSTVTTLVQSSLAPHCSALGGDLYVLIGAGGLRVTEDGGEECQTQPQWSAVCCAVPEGQDGFSVGLIRQTEEGERQVSVKELEEILGVSELFAEGCGGTDGATVGVAGGLHSQAVPRNVEEAESDSVDENTAAADVESNTAPKATEEDVESDAADQSTETEAAPSQTSSQDTDETREAQTVEKQAASSGDAQSEEADITQQTDTETLERRKDEHQDVPRSVSSESQADYENVDEQETDTNSSSAVVYILSTMLSVVKAPLRPVFSTITQLPGQVTYVLQEDLCVLCALPGETFSFFQLLTSGVFSWIRSAVDILLGVGETCFSNVYYCSSSMLGALFNSCHTGVTGVGTLAGDTVGIFGGALDNVWWVTKFFGGRLWEQSEGYVGTVVSEMGGQAKAVGGGVGRLAWRSGNGVGNVCRLGGGIIMGVVDVIIGAVRGAFGEESE